MNEEHLLTPKEKEALSNLKPGFNIVKESTDPFIVAARRVEISRRWSNKLLKISFVLNIITIVCFLVSAVFVALKPEPDYYASTPSGKIIGPLKKVKLE